MPYDAIDAERAALLKAQGLTWPKVAAQLSAEARRKPGYVPHSVAQAVYRAARPAKEPPTA